MILIADSGSTKCDWVALNSEGTELFRTRTMGFNPLFHTSETITEELAKNPELQSNSRSVVAVFYYGAGCSSPERSAVIQKGIAHVFPQANVMVHHDLLGAAYAAYDGRPNITCILGTGSNSCYFDGRNVKEMSPSLGFILGDEGSGAYFGKKIIAAYLYGHLSKEATKKFDDTFKLSMQEIISRVYTQPHANRFLADFSPFIYEFRKEPIIEKMLQNGMKEFLHIHVSCFPEAAEVEIHFVGSVAFHFQEALHNAATELGLKIGNIIRRPIDPLVDYHVKNILPEFFSNSVD